jgi:hypothetical protein
MDGPFLVYGGSWVPARVHGPQRAIRQAARALPATAPSRAIAAAA